MITLKDMDKAPARIERLKTLNEQAKKQIKQYRKEFANEWQVINVNRGIEMREAEIEELENALAKN